MLHSSLVSVPLNVDDNPARLRIAIPRSKTLHRDRIGLKIGTGNDRWKPTKHHGCENGTGSACFHGMDESGIVNDKSGVQLEDRCTRSPVTISGKYSIGLKWHLLPANRRRALLEPVCDYLIAATGADSTVAPFCTAQR